MRNGANKDCFRILLTGQATPGEISTGLIQLFEAKPVREALMSEIPERASAVPAHRLRHRD